MRKRTYTAIQGYDGRPTPCVSVDVTRVNDQLTQTIPCEMKNKLGYLESSTSDDVGGSVSDITTQCCSIADHASSVESTNTGLLACDSAVENMVIAPTAISHAIPTLVPTYENQSDTAPVATIHNLVGTCEIQSSITPIDLERVYRSLANSFYCRRRFAAITIRVTEPVCTGLLFTSGKLVITGCKTLVECVLASLKIVRMLERHIPTVTFLVRNAVVQNVVAHVVIPLQQGQRLNVDRLYDTWCCNCTFQKNMFPGTPLFQPLKLNTNPEPTSTLTSQPQIRSHLQAGQKSGSFIAFLQWEGCDNRRQKGE